MKNKKGQSLLNYAKESYGSYTLHFSTWNLSNTQVWCSYLIIFTLCSGQNYDGRGNKPVALCSLVWEHNKEIEHYIVYYAPNHMLGHKGCTSLNKLFGIPSS